jgi:predicted NUDIX family NTP pyrophosphohydrolase
LQFQNQTLLALFTHEQIAYWIMEISKNASLFIYRIREKGLEVFMFKNGKEEGNWQLPESKVAQTTAFPLEQDEKIIALDPVKYKDGKVEEGFAVEGDWHDIPSLKSLLMEDMQFVKDQIKMMGNDMMEKGTFVAVKEAIKRVAPHQYEMLKELKDIITDRNSVKNL